VLEEFVVASWDDHLRQHERVTKRELYEGTADSDGTASREHVSDEQYKAAAAAAQAS
jgi:hypothetical protein